MNKKPCQRNCRVEKRSRKELELQQVLKEERKSRKAKEPPVLRDKVGKKISKGDWVKATTPGIFLRNEGKVLGYKSWVMFEDITGVKQIRAPHNLLVCDYGRKRNARGSDSASVKQK